MDATLRRDFSYLTNLHLAGHGYYADRDRLKAIRILAFGGVFSHLRHQSFRYPQAEQFLVRLSRNLAFENNDRQGWSRVDRSELLQAQSLVGGQDADDSYVCPLIWSRWHAEGLQQYLEALVGKTVAECVQEVMRPLETELEERQEELGSALSLAQPKYAVFGDRRRVKTDFIALKSKLDTWPAFERAATECSVPP